MDMKQHQIQPAIVASHNYSITCTWLTEGSTKLKSNLLNNLIEIKNLQDSITQYGQRKLDQDPFSNEACKTSISCIIYNESEKTL